MDIIGYNHTKELFKKENTRDIYDYIHDWISYINIKRKWTLETYMVIFMTEYLTRKKKQNNSKREGRKDSIDGKLEKVVFMMEK